MPTTNPRVNITLDDEHLKMISKFAGSQRISVSAAAKQLILEALQFKEDFYFSEMAENVEKRTKKWISHSDAWK
jgi:hypothetical protein